MPDPEERDGGGPGPEPEPAASGQSRRGLGLLAATLVVAAAVIVSVGVFFTTRTYVAPVHLLVATPDGTVTYHGKTMQHVTLSLDTYPDAAGYVHGKAVHPDGNSGWPTYGPSNQFQVPAHAMVTITVKQYDSGGSLNNSWFDTVRGTVGGVAKYNGTTKSHINPNNVGHTFTVRGAPGVDKNFFVSVPLPLASGASDTGQHQTIVFSFVTGSKGLYGWNCEFPCGDSVAGFGGPMSTWGYMSGYLHVV